MERYIATALGDEFSNLRDDIAERKKNGEGFYYRTVLAALSPSNWRIDPYNEFKESKM